MILGEQITKLVPLLTPVEECIDVPKETCHKVRGNPKKVVKQVKKKWCYKPSEESGLAQIKFQMLKTNNMTDSTHTVVNKILLKTIYKRVQKIK